MNDFKICLTSSNPAKRRALEQVVEMSIMKPFSIVTLDIESDVSPTPLGDEECIQGCLNRIKRAREYNSNFDIYIGAEGGIKTVGEFNLIGGWVVIENLAGVRFIGSSAWVQIPKQVVAEISSQVRLNEVLDYTLFSSENIENKSILGTNGLITDGVYTRVNEFEDALRVAFSIMKKWGKC